MVYLEQLRQGEKNKMYKMQIKIDEYTLTAEEDAYNGMCAAITAVSHLGYFVYSAKMNTNADNIVIRCSYTSTRILVSFV